ncbi:MAG: Lrp/AsnC ligand binding domain-containing protein [Candidatus Kariarchaeaceae archaeon]
MVSAYLFINLEIDIEEVDILSSISDISEVKFAHQVYGTYDVVMLIEAETSKALKQVILRSIRRIQHVRSTMTLLSLASYEKSS